MKKYKRAATLVVAICLLLFVKNMVENRSFSIQKAGNRGVQEGQWNSFISTSVNSSLITMETNGKSVSNVVGAYMSDDLEIMIPVRYANDVFDCAAILYADNLLVLERNTDKIELTRNSTGFQKQGIIEKDGKLYVSASKVCEGLNLKYEFDMETNKLSIMAKDLGAKSIPYKYDLRNSLRAAAVKNQGQFGTCWAFAALSAMESSLLPADSVRFSVDHMTYNNSFNMDANTGGGYTMGMAYLVNWQGPVYEKDDPYGDGKTDSSLKAVKHVQEIRLIGEKDLEGVKKAVYKYGAVQTSIYNSLSTPQSGSPHYNSANNAYCYIGTQKPNHEICIVGWDDNYPKENFAIQPEGDGAFICQNSWGSTFGDDGFFYASYHDTNIAVHNLSYTSIEDPDNYDSIYQADLCGWVGQIGFNNPAACAMNVYQAENDETLESVGFYAVGPDTKFKVYVVEDFKSVDDVKLSKMKPVAEGTLENAGFYTIPIEKKELQKGNRFAVIIKVIVPNAVHPIAIEYQAGELTKDADLSDGEGYVSFYGDDWVDTEDTHNCNVCLKAYTKKKK